VKPSLERVRTMDAGPSAVKQDMRRRARMCGCGRPQRRPGQSQSYISTVCKTNLHEVETQPCMVPLESGAVKRAPTGF
jgi:hypothetical protein